MGRARRGAAAARIGYVTSLGSQQGNRHVHWHLLPLPPGVPYADQQMAVFAEHQGWLEIEELELRRLADALRAAFVSG